MRDDFRKGLGLGLSGAHRTGKTTIAGRLAEANECKFIRSSAGAIAGDMGITVRPGMPMEERLQFQERLLSAFLADYERESDGSMFVTDRTPLDLAAYAMIDWNPTATDGRLDAWLADYVRRCMDATSAWFFFLGIVQPAIDYVIEPGKPAPNTVYQELLNTTIIGLSFDPTLRSSARILPRRIVDNEARCTAIAAGYAHNISRYQDAVTETMTEQ